MNVRQHELATEIAVWCEAQGLSGVVPSIISDGGNLLLHLAPHAIVARAAVVLSAEDAASAEAMQRREIRVARHLHRQGVPAIAPADRVDPGPHLIGGVWVTFWPYIARTRPEPLQPARAAELVAQLTAAMGRFKGPLPALGAWHSVTEAAARLRANPDARGRPLLARYDRTDRLLRALDPAALIPSHGDAHPGNLIASPEGWTWIDFEDVSRMPAYWDMASYAANPALLGEGAEEPIYVHMLRHAADPAAFRRTIGARVLMSILSNLDFALRGHGDLAFAGRQLDRAEPFFAVLEAD